MTLISRTLMMFAVFAALAQPAEAQRVLLEVMELYGIEVPGKDLEAAFDAGVAPTAPLTPGSFATPVGMLEVATGRDRVAAAYAFGILAGRSARGAAPEELAVVAQALRQMVVADDRRTRIAGARVAGRVLAASFESGGVRPRVPPGLVDGLYVLLNRSDEWEQLAAMDALGSLRETSAVAALTERYHFYRESGKRALAGGALEALARIGDPSSVALVKLLIGDRFAEGNDPTALAVWFARERLLNDGSIGAIREAAANKRLRPQARGYLEELGAPVP
ncbi:MAG: hypothetical protein Q8T13_16455 [Acidobacteriota bacterium]|nr:hypothetical protein [Acidobacteriota bacterium]